MKFLVSNTVLSAAGETQAEIDLLLRELAEAEGVSAGPSVNGVADAVALTPRKGGLLLVILDADERPLQMFPLKLEVLSPHFDLYARTIENLSSTADLTTLRGFEALDYGKRVAHTQAGEAVQELLQPVLSLDVETARRVFSLLFVIMAETPVDVRKKHRRH